MDVIANSSFEGDEVHQFMDIQKRIRKLHAKQQNEVTEKKRESGTKKQRTTKDAEATLIIEEYKSHKDESTSDEVTRQKDVEEDSEIQGMYTVQRTISVTSSPDSKKRKMASRKPSTRKSSTYES